MTQQPRFRRICSFLVALAIALVPVAAHAKKKPRKDGIYKLVDDGAKAAKVTKPQKVQAHASVEDVVKAVDEAFGPMTGSLPEQDELYRLFSAPKVDVKALDAIRTRRDALHDKVAAALIDAFARIYKILDPGQRDRIVAWARQKIVAKQQKGFKQKLVASVINSIVDSFLDQLGATEPERATVRSVRERVTAVYIAARGDQVQMCDELGTIFTGPQVDQPALERFRAAHIQAIRALLVSLQGAFVELHDVLTPEHRAHLVALLQNQTAAKASSSSSDESDTTFQ